MRILLASTASYVPPRGGSTRSNLAWLDSLAGAGHACSIVASAAERDTPGKQARVDRELREQGIDPASIEVHDRVEHARRGAIEIFSSR
ncbi:MAG: hypothetical protein HYS04_15880, partial [Acidobacteria bacterium]|nr:hypothetical protein [Acidobacteriota bacterium]